MLKQFFWHCNLTIYYATVLGSVTEGSEYSTKRKTTSPQPNGYGRRDHAALRRWLHGKLQFVYIWVAINQLAKYD